MQKKPHKKPHKKRRGAVLFIVVLVVVFFAVQYFWISFIVQPIKTIPVTALAGEQLSMQDFLNRAGLESSNPFMDIQTKYIEGPDTQIAGGTDVKILVYNHTGYFDVLTSPLNVINGNLVYRSDTEITPGDVNLGYFVDPSTPGVELVSVSDEPVFDAAAGMYSIGCVVRLGERSLPGRADFYDRTAPVITGVKDIEATMNESILYRDGVSVSDNLDKDVKLEIESNVDISEPGEYSVTYRALDVSGNKTEVTARVNILSAEYVWVEEKAEEVLGRILTDDMTPREKARAIYVYMRTNIRYAAAPQTEDTYEGAHYGFTRGAGDCFTFYAMSEVLLTHAGIDNMRIQRIPEAPVNHFWNLVNLGEGWYHFDSTPPFVPFDGFMFTESQARVYADMQSPYRANYFTYIKENYPEVVQ